MTLPTVTLRPYLPEDAPVLAAIFQAAIMMLTDEDYSHDQREAWAASADDIDTFGEKLAAHLTLIAAIDGDPAGFATLKDNRVVEMLYVHPDCAGMGVGASLLDALEKLAGARGTDALTVDASETALLFFEKHGYAPQSRNTLIRNGEFLSNTTMTKRLGGEPPRKVTS
jgi:putative acetyltransferase